MADIELAAGEKFTHIHPHDTVTELKSGHVEITLGDKKHLLVLGHTVRVPAGVPHSMHNTGTSVAMCRCMPAA